MIRAGGVRQPVDRAARDAAQPVEGGLDLESTASGAKVDTCGHQDCELGERVDVVRGGVGEDLVQVVHVAEQQVEVRLEDVPW
jgi:hypothetical protein